MSLLDRLLHRVPVPEDAVGALEPHEEALVVAPLRRGHLVATRLGLWAPGEAGPRRLDWHLVSRATWDGATLELVVAEVTGQAGEALLLADVARHGYTLEQPGKLPQVVQQRVTSSIRSTHHEELPGGGAWFVQRTLPGRDGVVLQVRVDQGTDREVVADIAASVAARLPRRS